VPRPKVIHEDKMEKFCVQTLRCSSHAPRAWVWSFLRIATGALLCGLSIFPARAATITYVQGNYSTPQTPQSSVTVTYTAAQAAGDLNVVAVGWNDTTATVSSITDKSGNTYTLAVGPTVRSGFGTQSIYYAKNIAAAAAGANTVTVTFSTAAVYPDIRILEYSGADPNNPVDVKVANTGNSTTSSSGSVTTTTASDLLFAANLVGSTTTGPGAGYTTRLLTQPDEDIAEDRMVTATGSYSATAPITPSNPWIMQLVAFRAPVGGGTAPTLTSVTPNSGPTTGGTSVTITGTNFATGATVKFGSAAATNVVVASSTSITATTPAGSSGAVTVTVTVGGQSGSLANGFTYSSGSGPTAPIALTVAANGPSPSVVASQSYINTNPLISHTTAAFNSTGGDVIILAASSHSGAILTPSDNLGNTWIPISGPTNANSSVGFDLRTQIWYARSPNVGSGHTITMAISVPQPLVMSVIVASGSNVSSPIDAVSLIGSDNGTQTTSVTTPSITTSGTNDLLVGFVKVASSTNPQPGPGFTVQTGATLSNLVTETGSASTPGTYDATFTLSAAQSWEAAVVALANSPDQVTLSWTASTDTGGTITNYLIERCQGLGCTNFSQIAITSATTYNDMALAASTSYSYRVRAEDSNNNIGPYSATATAATPAPVPSTPSAPENLTATGPIVIGGQNYINSTALTSHTTTPFDSTGGSLLLLAATSRAGITFTPSDSLGNSWVSAAGPTSTSTGADLRTQIWYAQNPVVGADQTVTVALSAAEPLAMSVVVLKGTNLSSPIDAVSVIGSDSGGQSTNASSPALSTTALNDLLVGFGVFSSGFNSMPYASLAGSGFTEQAAPSSTTVVAESAPAASPGNYAATFVLGSSQTWQAAVVAAANDPSQITLSWTPSAEIGGNQIVGSISSYSVERCQGTGCSTFAQIASLTTTSYTDTGLAAGNTYSYRVRAQDSNGSLGPYSNVLSVTTTSTSGGPSAPTNLTAAANRNGPMNLSWSPSTSSVGIADYQVFRCQGVGCANFAELGTATGTSYLDSNVLSGTTYSYEVRAVDNNGSYSPFSNIASNTTVGSQPPTAPGNLTATPVSTTQINLSWTASTSSIGLANYVVQRCQGAGCSSFSQIGTPTGTTFSDTGLVPATNYSYRVEAIDIEGNVSSFSNITTATTLSPAPTITYVQGNYSTPQTPQSSVTVTYTAAQAAGDLNVVAVGWNDTTATVSSITDKSGNTYTLAVGPTVRSGFGTQSIYYAKNIAAAAAGANTVTVTFSTAAVYPDIRILEYSGADPNNPVDVKVANTGNSTTSSSGSVTTTTASDLLFAANLVGSTTTGPGAGYTTRLLTQPDEDIAEDRMVTATGSYSATAPITPSNPWIMQLVAFRSTTCPAPTAPGNLTATATSSTQVNLSWNASTSCYGISSYVVQRCQGPSCSSFTQVGTSAGTSFSDTGLTANTSYSYQVQAIDDSGNVSVFSNQATATTLAISISPRAVSVTSTQTQQFTSAAGVTWSVDGVIGGSPATGTISPTGLYTPPATSGTHTVTATTSSQQSASATVYITNYPGTFTYHNDNLRTGQNLSETVLTLNNVNKNQFGKLATYALDGMAFASPLYVASVNIPGQGYHNVVYVATEHDSVYAFDADGLSSTPLWRANFLSSGVTSVPCADVGGCGDILNEVGITGTPVIDQTTGTLYVVAATKEGSNTWVQRLHALDITSGAEKFGGPVVIQAAVPGTGEGSTGNSVPFDSLHENQRPGLLLNNGVVYVGFGSHNDTNPWHGWVLGYNAATLQLTVMFNATPNTYGGGIWQSGGGLAADASGNIYFSTSNGPFDVNSGGVDYADSIMKLSSAGAVLDYFTPHDQSNMDINNIDLGSAGPVLLVDQTTGNYPHLLISAGKSGTIYVINRDNMGHYNTTNDNQIVQVLPGILPNGNAENGNFSQPAYFNGYVYFGAVNDSIKAFQLTNGLLSTVPASQTQTVFGVRGASFAISANGSNNGILWALQNNGTSADTDNTGNPGVLFAYDANNLATELYDSSQAGSRDTLDFSTKFAIPLVANGKVYIGGQTQLTVFGLLP